MLHTVQTLVKISYKPLMSFLLTLWSCRLVIGIVMFCCPFSLLKAELLLSGEKWPKLVRIFLKHKHGIMFLIVYNTIIIMTHLASRRIRPSRFLTNTPCPVPPLWLLPSLAIAPCFFPSQPSFSKLSLVSLSAFWCPPQCCGRQLYPGKSLPLNI